VELEDDNHDDTPWRGRRTGGNVVLTRACAASVALCLVVLASPAPRVAALSALAAALHERPQAAGTTLRGRVEIRHLESAAPPRPGIAELGADLAYQPADRRRAVVYLEAAPTGAFEKAVVGAHTVMNQAHETFVPHVLAIQAGTVVDFPNQDPFFHNVFSLSKPKRFDLGRYARGRSKSVRFDEPGVVRVFCDIHSHMSAFILVFAHRFFAVTDDQGAYRIEGVPPGPSTVVAWYEGEARTSRRITVPEGGGTLDVDFRLEGR
jgi:plastocyanin